MVVVDVLLVDDQQVALVHVDSPNIVDSTIEDNGNFDKTNRHSTNKMHMVRFLEEMDQYQAKHHRSFTTNYSTIQLTSL
jgi:hypothetical protein